VLGKTYSVIKKYFMILKNWNLFRVLRTALGLFILIQGIVSHDFLSIVLGTGFAGMAIFNVGCCAAGGCGIDQNQNGGTKIEDVSFEEVKIEK
jgi:hypothetical protein